MRRQFYIEYDSKKYLNSIDDIESIIVQSINKTGEIIKDNTMMVISELIENAIKYGKPVSKYKNIKLDFVLDKNKIEISVTNVIDSKKNLNSILDHIERIKNCSNPEDLFIQKMIDVLDCEKKVHSQFGLYRIAYEGKYQLSYNYYNSVLRVIAIYDFQNTKSVFK